MELIIVFGIVFVIWLVLHALTERAYKKKAAFEERQRYMRANIAVAKLAKERRGQ